jgi:type I restriction enzyme M protein
VLTNRKPADRQGKVQLIDATSWFKPLRKNLGKKNCELSEDDTRRILEVFLAFEETEQSKIFPNKAFGYWKITVERPLRLRIDLGDAARTRFRLACEEVSEEPMANLVDRLVDALGPGLHLDFNAFLNAAQEDADRHHVKFTVKRQKLLQTALAIKNEHTAPVVKKVHKLGKAEPDPLHGRFAVGRDHSPHSSQSSLVPGVIEYEPDPELRDTGQVPLLEEGGIEAFVRREVLPHVPDAWIDAEATKIGYEISFTRYFDKPQPLRTLEAIRGDIEALHKETEGLLDQNLMDVEASR